MVRNDYYVEQTLGIGLAEYAPYCPFDNGITLICRNEHYETIETLCLGNVGTPSKQRCNGINCQIQRCECHKGKQHSVNNE